MRHDKTRRADQVRRDPQQHFALGQRFRDQPELVLLEIAQAAMYQLAAGRAGMSGEVVFLHQQDGEPAPGCISGDPGAVDAPTDDQKIVAFHK